MKKKYLVLGAGGFIGSAIAHKLLDDGHVVIACMRFKDENPVQEALSAHGATVRFLEDVSVPRCLEDFRNMYNEDYDGIIYSVGHCPPNGFLDVIKRPLSTLPLETLDNEYAMHVRGPANTFKTFLNSVPLLGSFLFVSSGITRLTDATWPNPKLLFHYHVGAIENMNRLISMMRLDPTVKGRGIKIYRLIPPAVDTPFHQGGPRPPMIVSLDEVAARVTQALAGETESEDVPVIPKGPVLAGV